MQSTSRLGLLFIARREGLVLTAYQDGKHMSIGFGHNDPSLEKGDKVTVKQAFALLKSDVTKRERELYTLLNFHGCKQHEWDAMMSLLFNRGGKAVKEIAGLVADDRTLLAADEFLKWGVNAKGDPIKGILKRREMERDMFLTANYGEVSPIPMWKGNPRTTNPESYHVQDDDL